MILDTMTLDERLNEMSSDYIWITNMYNGWYKKYAKALRKRQTNKRIYIDKKRYVTPNNNSLYVLFFIEKSDYNSRFNKLVWYLLFELVHNNGSSSFISYGDSGAVTITSHAIQRMHERSGKSFFELFVQDAVSSKNGILGWKLNDYTKNPNERICAWGDGVLLAIKLRYNAYVATTYLDRDDMHSNQMQQAYESLIQSQRFFEQQRGEELLCHPKLTGIHIKCSA